MGVDAPQRIGPRVSIGGVLVCDHQERQICLREQHGSNNISSYSVGRDGTLALLVSVAASTGAAPIDMALRGNSKFLYVLNATARSIDVFRVDRRNGQPPVTSVSGLPAGANGLVPR